MTDSISHHGMDKLVQISVGILLAAIMSLAYWETFSQDKTNSTAITISGRIMDGLKTEIHENMHKLHDEMGFAEWIVYFIYGGLGFVAAFLALIFLLILLKIFNNSSKSSTDASTQTDSITNILHDLMDSLRESEAALSVQKPHASTICTEDSGVNFVRDFEETDSKHRRYELEEDDCAHSCNSSDEEVGQDYKEYPVQASENPLFATTRLDISFFKTHNRYHSGDTVLQNSFTVTTPEAPGAVVIVECYSTHYFMPASVILTGETSPFFALADNIPKIEITVDGPDG